MVNRDDRRLDEIAANLAGFSEGALTVWSDELRVSFAERLIDELSRAFDEGDERLLESVLYADPFAYGDDADRELLTRLRPPSPLRDLYAMHALAPDVAAELIEPAMATISSVRRAASHLLGIGSQPSDVPPPPLNPRPAQSLTVIVHGTAAAKDSWWRPNGQFAKAVHSVTGDVYQFSDYFYWSGFNRNADRHQAAAALKAWVATRLGAGGTLRVIAHSHGGNVAILATRLGLRMSQLILLGTPMRTEYVPDMDQVGRLDNVYAPQDMIQSPGGALPWIRGEGRTLGDTRIITNHPVRAGVGGARRSHSDLHEWSVWKHADNHLDELLT